MSRTMKTIEETKDINVMELVYADYNKHVVPKQEEKKAIEKAMNELSDEMNNLIGLEKAEAEKQYVTLYDRRRAVEREHSQMSSEYSVNLELLSMAREIEGVDRYNLTIDLYREVNEKLKECAPSINKLIQLYGGFKVAPLLVSKFSGALNESNKGEKKDKAELTRKFMEKYNSLESEKQAAKAVKEKFSDKLKSVLRIAPPTE